MRKISQFPKNNDDLLSQTLSRFEDNVAAQFDVAARSFTAIPQMVSQTEADVTLRLNEIVKVNTPAATSVNVTLPTAGLDNVGRWAGVIRITGSGTITVRGGAGQLVQGVAADVLPATRRLYHYVSDGTGWWRT